MNIFLLNEMDKMKSELISLIILVIIITIGCQEQNKNIENNNSNGSHLSFPMAYKVEGHNPDFTLPESLSKERTGNAVIEVFLSNGGESEGFNLTYLKLSGGKSKELRHYKYSLSLLEEEDYPNDVRKFLPLFKDYLSCLTFVRNENVTLNEESKYLIKIPIKLK